MALDFDGRLIGNSTRIILFMAEILHHLKSLNSMEIQAFRGPKVVRVFLKQAYQTFWTSYHSSAFRSNSKSAPPLLARAMRNNHNDKTKMIIVTIQVMVVIVITIMAPMVLMATILSMDNAPHDTGAVYHILLSLQTGYLVP